MVSPLDVRTLHGQLALDVPETCGFAEPPSGKQALASNPKEKLVNEDQVKGKAKQAEGEAQESWGDAKEKVGDAVEGAKKEAGDLKDKVGNMLDDEKDEAGQETSSS